MRDASRDSGGLSPVGDIAEQDRHVAASGHDGATKVVHRVRAPQRLHGPLDRSLRDDPARGVHVRLLDRVHRA
ncbi:MAG TPA: hypothetical protein VIR54_25200, partial [Vicinamibacterales bacterium]